MKNNVGKVVNDGLVNDSKYKDKHMQQNKCLIIQGFAGLGNRLRTAAAGIEYSLLTNRDVFVNWSDGMFADEGVNAFDKCFELYDVNTCNVEKLNSFLDFYPKGFNKTMIFRDIARYYKKRESSNFIVRKITNAVLRLVKNFLSVKLCFNLALCVKYFAPQNESLEKLVFGGELKKLINDVVIFVDNVPKYKKTILYKHIRLKRNVDIEVNQFVLDHGLEKNSIGIHIRATDKSYKGSLNSLLKRLEKFIDKKKIKKIFLSTDSKDIELMMIDHFGDLIVTLPKVLPNDNNKEGIHYWAIRNENQVYRDKMFYEAVLDMFILSKTEYLLYQWGSTFSEVSSVYHGDKTKCMSWRKFQILGFKGV